MFKKYVILLFIIPLIFGCATLNFSSKYYTLPTDYKKDIEEVWNEINTKITLKHRGYYYYRIVKDNQTIPAGMPQSISEGYNRIILLPEYFIKYVWEFYYPNYHKDIIGCLFAHELGHPESGFLARNPQEHLACDEYSISNLLLPSYTSNTYYSMLIVGKDYLMARKGAVGHLANIGWNVLNVFTLVYAGTGTFIDWYANDLTERISAIKSTHNTQFIFKRSSYQRTIK